MRRFPAVLLLAAAALIIVACGGGSDDDDPTSTATPAATAEPTSDAPSDEIRSIDLEVTPAVSDFASDVGGEFARENVLYADLTGDDVEDAVVPLSSGGTLGDVGFIVVTPAGDDSVAEVLSVDAREFGVAVSINDDGKLASVEPIPGPDDPECCPSQIRTTIYVGDGGTGLVVESSVVEDNSAGGAKTPATED